MNLLVEPWIDVFTVDGPATVSLHDLAANLGDILDIASDDPLVDAAILRMLMAADLVSGGDIGGWLDATANRWNLFDEERPFWQNPTLREHVGDKTVCPAAALSYRHAGNGATLLDHHHNESGVRLTPAAAVRSLMMRQQFSVGGIQPFPESIFGIKSAKLAVATARPFVWIDAGTLAGTLAVNRRPGPVGTFHHSWPGGTPGCTGDRGGQADALTWQARSILLIPDADGYITGFCITEGIRYGDVTDPQDIPHTAYTQAKKDDPFIAWNVHSDRPAWRQLLTAFANAAAPGVLAGELDGGQRIRLAGLASYQSRIDGPVTGSLPLPQIDRTAAARLVDGIAEARKHVSGRLVAAGREMVPSSSPTGSGAWWRRVMPTDTRLNDMFEPVVRCALTGEMTVDEAVDAMRALAAACVDEFAGSLAPADPVAAARATITDPTKGSTS